MTNQRVSVTENGRKAYEVDVKDINVRRPELLEGLLDRNMEGLHVVAKISSLLLDVAFAALEVERELRMKSVTSSAL